MTESKTTFLTIRKKEHRKSYTTIELDCVKNKELTWGAKGLHLYLCSRPPNWKVRHSDLVNRSKDGKDALTARIKELKLHGYLEIIQIKNESRKIIGTEWIVSEIPLIPHPENPDMDDNKEEKPYPDFPRPENPHYSNNDINNKQTIDPPLSPLLGGKGVTKKNKANSNGEYKKLYDDLREGVYREELFQCYDNLSDLGKPIEWLVAELIDRAVDNLLQYREQTLQKNTPPITSDNALSLKTNALKHIPIGEVDKMSNKTRKRDFLVGVVASATARTVAELITPKEKITRG